MKKRAPAKRDVSGVITGVALRYVRDSAGDEGVAAVLSAAREERTVADLEDPTAWSTDAATVALLGAAGRVLGDPEISRHVGAAIVRQYEWTADGERMRPADLLGRLSAESAGLMPIAPMVVAEGGDERVVVEVTTRPRRGAAPGALRPHQGPPREVPAVLGLGRGAVVEEQCQARGRSAAATGWSGASARASPPTAPPRLGRRRRPGPRGASRRSSPCRTSSGGPPSVWRRSTPPPPS